MARIGGNGHLRPESTGHFSWKILKIAGTLDKLIRNLHAQQAVDSEQRASALVALDSTVRGGSATSLSDIPGLMGKLGSPRSSVCAVRYLRVRSISFGVVVVSGAVHPDVALVMGLFDVLGVEYSPAVSEPDNAEYGAVIADVGQSTTRFRVGKLTPRKVGLFVSVWRRAPGGSTEPFPAEGNVDMLVVAAREGDRFGAFVFPTEVLVSRGVVSVDGVGGTSICSGLGTSSATRHHPVRADSDRP